MTAALLAGLAGCPDRGLSRLEGVPSSVSTKDIPITADLDILFVIDNSSSTQDKQKAFAANFGNFVAALQAFPTGQPNLHIGVITTTVDIGVNLNDPNGDPCHPASTEDGRLQNHSNDVHNACGQPTPDRYLSDLAIPGSAERDTNYAGDLSTALACIADVGTSGCGFESPLEAIRRALDGTTHPDNAGFLRKGAFLAVVILTDEDDCSAPPALFRQTTTAVGERDLRCSTTAYDCDQHIATAAQGAYTGCKVRHNGFLYNPSDYVDFLSGIKGSDGVAVAVIAGDPSTALGFGEIKMPFAQPLALLPGCNTTIDGSYQIARPALRLAELADGFGGLGLFRSICQSDYSGAVADIGALLFQAVSPCIEGQVDPRDGAPNNPGLQPDCTVTELVAPETTTGDAEPVGTVVPRCKMLDETHADPAGARPCWWMAQHVEACAATETGLQLHIERSALPAPNTKDRVSCSLVSSP